MADNRKKQERAELHRTIWGIANDLRGSVDGVVAWMQLVRRRRLPGWRLRLETRLPRRE